jgi:pyrimidine-nucleoside phosphorylase
METNAVRRLIERKRDGGRIEAPEWRSLIRDYVRGRVDEAQMSALAMACVFMGLDLDETVGLTGAMIESGERIDLGIDEFVLDKHASGGVGDTVSLIVVPLVAACGVRVAKVSGRALGHTGGTLDKLEAIPGVRTELSPNEFVAVVREVGCAIVAQSTTIVPADKQLYALRDRTGTIPSPGLIAASMVSKKIAGGADGIVYDVKCGNGAFVKDVASAHALARMLVDVTESFGRQAAAIISDMDEPLGTAIGAGLEAIEARDYLSRTHRDPRLHELVYVLAGTMLELAGHRREELVEALADYGPYERFVAMIEAQGGTREAFEALAPPVAEFEARAQSSGYVTAIDAVQIGELARDITARGTPCSGIRVERRIGDAVRQNEALGRAIGGTEVDAWTLAGAFAIGPQPPDRRQLVVETLSGSEARSTSAMR